MFNAYPDFFSRNQISTLVFGIILTFSHINSFALDNEPPKRFSTYINTANRLGNEIKNIEAYLLANPEYNQKIIFLLDMRVPSEKKRFYIYDFEARTIVDIGMVAHGLGSVVKGKDTLIFSNKPNSNMTSIGKYSVGVSYKGKFGKAYRLEGLDSTNNNAMKRAIVLHKYKDIPLEEQYYPICLSLGCPMVNEHFFAQLEQIIDNSPQRILMYVYY